MNIIWDDFKFLDLVENECDNKFNFEDYYKDHYNNSKEYENNLTEQLNEEQNKLLKRTIYHTINSRDETWYIKSNFILKYGFLLGMEMQKFINEFDY